VESIEQERDPLRGVKGEQLRSLRVFDVACGEQRAGKGSVQTSKQGECGDVFVARLITNRVGCGEQEGMQR